LERPGRNSPPRGRLCPADDAPRPAARASPGARVALLSQTPRKANAGSHGSSLASFAPLATAKRAQVGPGRRKLRRSRTHSARRAPVHAAGSDDGNRLPACLSVVRERADSFIAVDPACRLYQARWCCSVERGQCVHGREIQSWPLLATRSLSRARCLHLFAPTRHPFAAALVTGLVAAVSIFSDEADQTVLRPLSGAAMIDVAFRIFAVVLIMSATIALANVRSNAALRPAPPRPPTSEDETKRWM
jgi:hypothetical protein